MHDDGEENDEKEQRIVEETCKYIVFVGFKFSGIDFVEDLQEDEDLEEHCQVDTVLEVPLFNLKTIFNTEDLRTVEKNGSHDNNLVDTVTEDVLPHGGSNHNFMTLNRLSLE